jgi:hypothetical protein
MFNVTQNTVDLRSDHEVRVGHLHTIRLSSHLIRLLHHSLHLAPSIMLGRQLITAAVILHLPVVSLFQTKLFRCPDTRWKIVGCVMVSRSAQG